MQIPSNSMSVWTTAAFMQPSYCGWKKSQVDRWFIPLLGFNHPRYKILQPSLCQELLSWGFGPLQRQEGQARAAQEGPEGRGDPPEEGTAFLEGNKRLMQSL